MAKRKEICELLDKLTLETLDLIEQDVKCKRNIENITNDGQLNMAKTRYITGQNSVSKSQLPGEDCVDFYALATLENDKNEVNGTKFELEQHTVDKEKGFFDPIQWFGILTPRNLQMARSSYRKVLDFIVESANIQTRLSSYYGNIMDLKKMKEQL